MEVIDAINNRSSVRRFSERIPHEHQIAELLEAAIRAPNAGNLQPWFFTVVQPDGTAKFPSVPKALGTWHVVGLGLDPTKPTLTTTHNDP